MEQGAAHAYDERENGPAMKYWMTQGGHTVCRVLGGRGNAYAIAHDGRLLLVDTGRTNRWSALRTGIESLIRQEAPSFLILSHTHFDHAENAARLRQTYSLQIIVHRSEGEYLRTGDSPLPRGSILLTRRLMRWGARMAQPFFLYTGVQAEVPMDEHYNLQPFGFNAYVLHTPGHTRGSLSLIIDDEIACVGDTLFGVVPGNVFPPFADDIPTLIRSWKKLLDTRCRLFLPGHGGAIDRALLQRAYARRTAKR